MPVSSFSAFRGAAVLLLAAAFAWAQPARAAEVVHVEPSRYAPVMVVEEFGERCIAFGDDDSGSHQTCMDLDDPQAMVFNYTRMMMGALYLQPKPQRILIVGLGGGTLPTALAALLPDAEIDTVEIDPAVVRVAERWFGFRQGPRQRVHLEDGRKFVESAAGAGRRYDLVMLDAYGADYIPRHLMTREFLQQVKAVLVPGGVLAANTFTGSELYHRESATYAEVFGPFFNLRANNRVILAVNGGALPDDAAVRANALALAPRLAPYRVDVERELARFSREQDWRADAQVLAD